MDIYKDFTQKELNKALRGEITNLLNTRKNINYIKGLSIAIKNLIRFYNLKNPDNPWRKTIPKTTSYEIQLALGINPPINVDKEGQDKDAIIYLRTKYKKI